MKKLILMVSALGLGVTSSAWSNPEVSFRADFNVGSGFTGKSDKVMGAAKAAGGGYTAQEIWVPVDTLRTGLPTRDQHMRDRYLEASKYPRILVRNVKAEGGKFKGEFEAHGVRQPIEGTYSVKGAELTAEFKCSLKNLKIEEPKFTGIKVKDEIRVEVTLPIQAASKPAA